jgi:two-component system, LytTR family, response regulator
MEALRVVIADDERLSRRALRAQLDRLGGVHVVAECADGHAALAAIEREEPDLIFLDIRMPHLSGFELLDQLEPGHRPAVIFVTAYDEHAIRAFEVRAVDYVLKPFDEPRLAAAVEHARVRLRERELSMHMESMLKSVGHAPADSGGVQHARRLLVRQAGRSCFVATREIDWIEAEGNYVRLHVPENTHLLKTSLSELERRLDPSQFMRIHRSTIVNLDSVAHVEPYGGSDYQVVLRDGTKLRVSRSSRDRLLKDTP